jgi:hypothetical protein
MAKGRKTGGRQKGTKNKRTLELEKRKEGQVPLDYLLEVMRDEKNDTQMRLDAAKSAAPYLHARRAPETKEDEPITYSLTIIGLRDSSDEGSDFQKLCDRG